MISKLTIFRAMRFSGLVLLFSLSNDVPVFGQAQRNLVESQQYNRIETDRIVIPGGNPTRQTRFVSFQNATTWFRENEPAVADFDSVQEVEVERSLSVELSTFISEFANLRRVCVRELPVEIDLEAVLRPLAKSKTLRSLEICMVEITYRDCTFLAEFGQLEEFRCDVVFSEKELLALRKLKNLHCLEIGEVINREQVHAVEFPNLKFLTISNPLDLAWFANTTEIEKLKIWQCCTENDLANISNFVSLKNLNIRLESVEYLNSLSSLKNLETLVVAIDEDDEVESNTDLVTNSIGMQLKKIEPGSFMMGSDSYLEDCKPVHQVEITRSFYMAIHEVTQSQWNAVMKERQCPWNKRGNTIEGDDVAATSICWEDAQEFVTALNDIEASSGRKYRLPTEAEWEYCCRAGTTTRFSFGDDHTNMNEYAWWGGIHGYGGSAATEQYAHEVGTKKANSWGLFDMHGNAAEWCEDWSGDDYYQHSPLQDPPGPSSGSQRVLRGGHWYTDSKFCGSAFRNDAEPTFSHVHTGFRVVCVIE